MRRAAWAVGFILSAAPLVASATPPVPLCEPVLSCGCYTGCGAFVSMDASLPDPRYRLSGGGDAIYTRAQPPYTPICDAKGHCTPPLRIAQEACDKSCAPIPKAPFVCESTANRCERRAK